MAETGRQAPYPPSQVIASVQWAPAAEIERDALGKVLASGNRDGSDNWPLTWADDDHLYTAYGDGYGFEPLVPSKLGLGFGRIVGGATHFKGENIRSDGENAGYGRSGKKASGLLMVDGILYLLARNADHDGRQSQLAWSTDRARTWTWCDWKWAELGYPTFINFGKNYQGARDPYVYLVSHDGPDAYQPADSFVLARVPKDRLRERSAYQFLEQVGADGQPQWTETIARRGAVFVHPGQCLRSGISYCAPLERYLWWQINGADKNGADTRFEGGFGMYDAPEPWGPWTTVYYTPRWDVGPGESACFPTKWMSADGRTCYLVFSGDDNFAVRRAVFSLKG